MPHEGRRARNTLADWLYYAKQAQRKSKMKCATHRTNLIKINWHLISCEWLTLVGYVVMCCFRSPKPLHTATCKKQSIYQFPLGYAQRRIHCRALYARVCVCVIVFYAGDWKREKEGRKRRKKTSTTKKCKWICITSEYICNAMRNIMLVWPIHPFSFNKPAITPQRHSFTNWKQKLICTLTTHWCDKCAKAHTFQLRW